MSEKTDGRTVSNCAEKVEVYSRVVGYFRPVGNWNKGKREEFKNRKSMNISGYIEDPRRARSGWHESEKDVLEKMAETDNLKMNLIDNFSPLSVN